MQHYFAPMEGITDSIYRRLHHQFFPGVDVYFMPFLSPTIHRCLTHKEDRELPLAASQPFTAVPQVLTKVPEDFLWAAQVCQDRGYQQVNLNIGCPSGTVVSKGKGSGMLRDLSELESFLDQVFARSPLPISIKTRLGLEDPQEFIPILELYNRYPIQELTIHPRVRKQFYSGSVDGALFRYAMENSRSPLCWSGDIGSLQDIQALKQAFPGLQAVMIGRGLVANPAMLCPQCPKDALPQFMDALLQAYTQAFGSSRNAMFRLKENWGYLHNRFEGCDKLWKRLRKTTDVTEFQAITQEIFQTLPLKST